MRKRTFAAVAGVAGGLGVAAAVAVSAITGEALGALPVPTVTVTTPVATATVALPPPPPVTTAVTATTPVATATVALPPPPPPLPPPPPPVQTVVSAVTTAAAPVTTTATGVAGAVGPAAPAPPSASSAQSASSSPAAASAGPGATQTGGAGTFATAGVTPTATQVRAAPTLRVRRQPGRTGARRLVLTLRRPRELTVLFRGPGDTCRVAGRLVVHGRRGTNVVPLNGRVREGRLAAGVFRVEILDTTGIALRVVGKLAVSLRYDARGRPQVRQVRYVPRDCALGVAALLASTRPVAGERATAAPAAVENDRETSPPAAAADEPVEVGSEGGQGGGLAALPNLAPGDAVGGVASALLVALLVVSACGFLLVAGGSAYRRLRG